MVFQVEKGSEIDTIVNLTNERKLQLKNVVKNMLYLVTG